MNKTSIEWVKNPDGSQGYTFNPISGCLNSCPYCYARKLANTRLRDVYLQEGRGVLPDALGWLEEDVATDPFYPRFWPDKLEQPMKRKQPAGIFTCDMSDLFGIGVPEQWTHSVFNFIERCPQHRFYLLTKQPQNLIKFSPFPDNCWVGVSATNWLMFSNALGHLASIQAKVKYLSFEPLLERIQFDMMQKMLFPRAIDWVIIGAQTKPYKPPELSWVREIVEAANEAGIPVFLKNNLAPLSGPERLWQGFHQGQGLRQELPERRVRV